MHGYRRERIDSHSAERSLPDRAIEGVEDEPAAVLPWPKEQDAGGAEILRRQAACPFQSFATRRLGARPMDATDWGLEARERGSVVTTCVLSSIPRLSRSRRRVTSIRAITQELDAFASEYATALEHKYVDNRSIVEELREALHGSGIGIPPVRFEGEDFVERENRTGGTSVPLLKLLTISFANPLDSVSKNNDHCAQKPE